MTEIKGNSVFWRKVESNQIAWKTPILTFWKLMPMHSCQNEKAMAL